MKANNKIHHILSELRKSFEEGVGSVDNNPQNLISELQDILIKKEKERKGQNNLLLILCAIILITVGYGLSQYDKNQVLENRVSNLERIDSLYTTFMEPKDGSISYRIDGNEQPISYRALMLEADTMRKQITVLDNKLYNAEFELNFIKSNYPIKVLRNGNSYTIQALELDSALILLEVYRNRLKYITDKNCWEIIEKSECD